jgi:hypothetical protein
MCVKSDNTYIGYIYHAEKKALCTTAKPCVPANGRLAAALCTLPLCVRFACPCEFEKSTGSLRDDSSP